MEKETSEKSQKLLQKREKNKAEQPYLQEQIKIYRIKQLEIQVLH